MHFSTLGPVLLGFQNLGFTVVKNLEKRLIFHDRHFEKNVEVLEATRGHGGHSIEVRNEMRLFLRFSTTVLQSPGRKWN